MSSVAHDTRTAERLWAALVAFLLTAGAAMALGNIFADTAWRQPALAAIAVAGALALAGSLARLPLAVTVVAGLAAGAAWLAAWWPLSAALPWSQRPAALRSGLDLANQEIATQVAPTPTLSGLLLVSVAGCFVVALAVALLMQRGAVLSAILVALVLWVVPLSVPVPDRPVVGAALLLLVPAVIALATVGTNPEQRRPVGLRIAALEGAALAVVLAGPAATALPWHDAPALVDLSELGTTLESSQPVVDVGDQLHLPAPRPVMSVQTSTPSYLRTAALEVFDGSTWRIGRDINEPEIPTGDLEDPSNGIDEPAPASSIEGTWDVTALSLPSRFLPIVNQPRLVRATDARADLTFNPVGDHVVANSMGVITDGADVESDYRIEAAIPAPSINQLANAGVDEGDIATMTQLPAGHEEVIALARDLVADANATSAAEQVLAIQDFFAGSGSEFSYSTDVPTLRGSNALEQFVLEERVGYCEYYAVAMAVMLRGLGIPTRVATGYLPGDELAAPSDQGPGVYLVSTSDAHAWVEVAFDDWGWVTFDPTPRGDTAALRPSAASLVNLVATGVTGEGLDDLSELAPSRDPRIPIATDLANPGDAGSGTRAQSNPWPLRIGLAMLGLLLAGAVALWWRRDHTVPGDAAGRIAVTRDRLLRTARLLGAGRRGDETLHELATRWSTSLRLDDRAAATVADVASRASFGPGGGVTEADAESMERAAERLTAQLRLRATPRQRLVEEVRTTVDV